MLQLVSFWELREDGNNVHNNDNGALEVYLKKKENFLVTIECFYMTLIVNKPR